MKRLWFAALIFFTLVGTMLGLLASRQVSAQVVTPYKWVKSDNTFFITGSSSDISSTNFSLSRAAGGSNIWKVDNLQHKDGGSFCLITLSITISNLANPSQGTLSASRGSGSLGQSNSYSGCKQSILDRYSSSVSIDNSGVVNLQNGDELAGQKIVRVSLAYANEIDSADDMIRLYKGGKEIATAVKIAKGSKGSNPGASFNNVEPGNYRICSDKLGKCVDKTKIKYSILQVELSSNRAGKLINVTENISITDELPDESADVQLLPHKLTLTNTATGNVITVDATPRGTTVDGEIVYSSNQTIYNGTFNNILAGTYKICSEVLPDSSCKTVEKVDGEDLDVTLEGTGDSAKMLSKLSSESDIGDKCYDGGTTLFGVIPKNPLKWIVCGVSNLLGDLIDRVNEGVMNLLEFDPTSQSGDLGSSQEGSEALKRVWASILIPANVLFVVAFLIMIISTALDLGVFNNYTVKKLLPRIIVAAILANVSWYVCASMIQITNVVGYATRDIILTPINEIATEQDGKKVITVEDGISESLSADGAGQFQSGVVVGLGSIILVSVLISTAWILPVLLTVALAVIVALLALLVRRIIIILLIVFAPIAFVLWTLPGGEKWTKRWWSLLSQMLLMYPMVMAAFASGVFISILVSRTSSGTGIATSAISFIALALPYFAIPALFKAASGTLGTITGMVNDRGKGLIDRSKKRRNQKMKQNYARKIEPKQMAIRSNVAGRINESASKRGKVGSFLMRGAARGVGGYNIEAGMSEQTAQWKKVIEDQIATGRDEDIRGLTVNRNAVNDSNTAKWVQDDKGEWGWDQDITDTKVLARTDKDGKKQYKTLGGAWVDEANVLEGHKRWGKNQFAKQAALGYEMRKAATDRQVQGIGERYEDLATGTGSSGWKLSERQAGGILKGAGFENQGTHLEFKHMKTDGTVNYKDFAEEMYEKKGSYPLAQMSAHTIQMLGEAYDNGDADTKQRVAATAEMFVQRGASMGAQPGTAGANPADVPGAPAAPGAIPEPGYAAQERVQTYGSGAAHVNEEIRNLAIKTGVYTAGTPPVPEQK